MILNPVDYEYNLLDFFFLIFFNNDYLTNFEKHFIPIYNKYIYFFIQKGSWSWEKSEPCKYLYYSYWD